MPRTLRDRRRRQTATEIQLAALRLSLAQGYGAVTTEAIAAEAGISTRTFFNYYPNKQAAVLGLPPRLDEAMAEGLVASDQPLAQDLAALLGQMLREKRIDRQVVRMMGQIWESTPELMAVFRRSMDDIAVTLAGVLARRMGTGRRPEAMLVAELATHALSHAVKAWAEDDRMSIDDLQNMLHHLLRRVGGALA